MVRCSFVVRFVVSANKSRATVHTAKIITDLESGRIMRSGFAILCFFLLFFLYFNYFIAMLEVIFFKNPPV